MEDTCVGYKLFQQRKDGSLGSLFINRRARLPIGIWITAEDHKTKGFAHRIGWHALLKRNAPHLKEHPKNGKRIWAKVILIGYETFTRPKSQGGTWLLGQKMLIEKTIR